MITNVHYYILITTSHIITNTCLILNSDYYFLLDYIPFDHYFLLNSYFLLMWWLLPVWLLPVLYYFLFDYSHFFLLFANLRHQWGDEAAAFHGPDDHPHLQPVNRQPLHHLAVRDTICSRCLQHCISLPQKRRLYQLGKNSVICDQI